MALSTLSKLGQKSYEISFEPITLTTEMRKNLFELLSEATLITKQLEILFAQDYSVQLSAIKESIQKFNYYKDLVENFVSCEG